MAGQQGPQSQRRTRQDSGRPFGLYTRQRCVSCPERQPTRPYILSSIRIICVVGFELLGSQICKTNLKPFVLSDLSGFMEDFRRRGELGARGSLRNFLKTNKNIVFTMVLQCCKPKASKNSNSSMCFGVVGWSIQADLHQIWSFFKWISIRK